MDALTLFGVASVSLMLVAYALEERSPGFVLLFAVACLTSAVYGYLAGAWPFGVVESVWSAVAVRRWRARTVDERQAPTHPIACDMTALSPAERRRYDTLRPQVLGAVEEVKGTTTGFRLRLHRSTSAPDVTEWMTLEHRCCPFLTMQLVFRNDGTSWIEIGGSAAIKSFLQDEFTSFAPA